MADSDLEEPVARRPRAEAAEGVDAPERLRVRPVLLLLKDLAGFAQETLAGLLKAAGILLILGTGFLLYLDVVTKTTTIEAIAVPRGLAERGYTPEVVARLLRDSMNRVIARASAPRQTISMRGDLPDIVVPTFGLSFETVKAYVRTAISPANHTVISGEIVGADDRFSLRLRVNGQEVFTSSGPFAPDQSDAWDAAANAILQHTAPYIAAWAEYEFDAMAAREEAEHIIATFPDSDENFAWAQVLLEIYLLDHDKADEAAVAFDRALKSAPGIAAAHVAAHVFLGNALARQGKFERAIDEFQTAISLDQHDPASYFLLGLALRDEAHANGKPMPKEAEEQFAKATAEFNREIKFQPGDAELHVLVGNVLALHGDPPEAAIAEYRLAIALDPRLPEAHSDLCSVLIDQWLFDDAIAECEIATKLAPRGVDGHMLMGAALSWQNKSDDAKTEFKKAIELDPLNSDAHVGLARLALNEADYDRALDEVDRALELAPRNANAHLARGIILLKREEPNIDESLKEFKTAINLSPSLVEPHVRLADLLMSKGEADKAESEYQKATLLDPRDPYPHMQRADTLKNQKKNMDALDEYRTVLMFVPRHGDAHENLLALLREVNDDKALTGEHRRWVDLRPDDAAAHIEWGDHLLSQDKAILAEDEYRIAVKLEPNDAAAHAHLGDALLEQDSTDEAIAEYGTAMKLETDVVVANYNRGGA